MLDTFIISLLSRTSSQFPPVLKHTSADQNRQTCSPEWTIINLTSVHLPVIQLSSTQSSRPFQLYIFQMILFISTRFSPLDLTFPCLSRSKSNIVDTVQSGNLFYSLKKIKNIEAKMSIHFFYWLSTRRAGKMLIKFLIV